jgi:hypothetical protein
MANVPSGEMEMSIDLGWEASTVEAACIGQTACGNRRTGSQVESGIAGTVRKLMRDRSGGHAQDIFLS